MVFLFIKGIVQCAMVAVERQRVISCLGEYQYGAVEKVGYIVRIMKEI